MSQDYQPFWARTGDICHSDKPFEFGHATDVVEIPVTWALDDYPQVEFLKSAAGVQPGPKTAREMFEGFFDDFAYMQQEDPAGFHMITMHPQVVGRGQRMLHFEAYLDKLVDHGAEFRTCEQIADEFIRSSRTDG